MSDNIYQFSCTDIAGKEQSLKIYEGQVLLVVNTASKCGFTPQYQALEDLYRAYAGRGFRVLGFPCNQFGYQEPSDEAGIQTFCTTQFDVTFPMFSKIEVKGKNQHPLYQWLTHRRPGIVGSKVIKWNFTKFLIDTQGQVVRRFAPITKPEHIAEKITAMLPG